MQAGLYLATPKGTPYTHLAMDAEIIATGTELLLGETLDTNSSYLATQLPSVGLQVKQVTLVDDNVEQLAEVLERAWNRSTFTFTIGGLGPTQDDVTRDAIARVLGESIFTDEGLLVELKAIFQRRGASMPPHNLKQAGLIPSAVGIPNRLGTAPGWWAERDGHIIAALPGPPRELQEMWELEIMPRIQKMGTGQVVLTRTLKTIGLSEALVDEMASSVLGGENPYTGIYAKPDGIHLRVIARAASQEEALGLVRPIEGKLRGIFTTSIWGVDSESPQRMVGELLTERGMTVATMESCTGGLLASTITDVSGSSAYFKGGIVSYTNDLKEASGVDAALIQRHGAVSQQVAEAMAEAVRVRLKADFGISVTGVAGPDSLEGVQPGTVYIGVAGDGCRQSDLHRFPQSNRSLIKHRSVVSALLALRRLLESTA